MKDESDRAHAEMENENLLVRAEVAERLLAKQGLTWDEIGEGLLLAGRIGMQALRLWISLKSI